jgi:hypothetical protein
MRLNAPTAPINQLLVRINRPAARFFAKITPKVAKTTSFPHPAVPSVQKAGHVGADCAIDRNSRLQNLTRNSLICRSS